jgi:endonuclease/exonuclease/phosphatase family metal-dependent hydrolase
MRILQLLILFLVLPISPCHANETIKLLTYNVWQESTFFTQAKQFLCANLGIDCKNERMQQLMALISRQQPDIVVLQESGYEFSNALKQALPEYQFLTNDQSNLVIASTFDLQESQFIPFPSYMHRGMLFTRLIIAQHPFCIANVHLESLLDDVEIRKRQLDSLFNSLINCKNILLAGDFNFADNAPEHAKIPDDYQDSWLINRSEIGVTYDLEYNPLAKSNALYLEKSRRLDRIYYHSAVIKPLSVNIIGNQRPMPSDHYGLMAEFSIKHTTN